MHRGPDQGAKPDGQPVAWGLAATRLERLDDRGVGTGCDQKTSVELSRLARDVEGLACELGRLRALEGKQPKLADHVTCTLPLAQLQHLLVDTPCQVEKRVATCGLRAFLQPDVPAAKAKRVEDVRYAPNSLQDAELENRHQGSDLEH